MMTSWEEFDTYVKQDIVKSKVEDGFLRAQLTVLLVKRDVTYQTPIDEIQQRLLEKFNVEYALEDVQDEINCMLHEEYGENRDVLEPEDYFEGY